MAIACQSFFIKLNRANNLFFKMKKYVSLKILRSICVAIFDSYLSTCCLMWALDSQNCSTIQRIIILQKRLLIINFQPISKFFNNLSPSLFNAWFSFSSDQHYYETSSSTQSNLTKHFYKTNRYVIIFSNCKCCGVVEQNPKTTKRYATWRSIPK